MTSLPAACTQLSLDLFPSPSFESILDFRHMQGLRVILSPRLRRGWYLKMDIRSGSRRLVVPAILDDAPHDVKSALIDWALLMSNTSRTRSRDRATAALKRELEHRVHRHFESCGVAQGVRSRFNPASVISRGCRYDLAEVFDSLNRTYFNGSLSSYVRWGTNRFRSYQSNKTRANGESFSLITIARMYNRPDTPRDAVEGIMFHEMVHIAVPPIRRDSRNIIHGPEFKRRERQFPGRAQWLAWEKSVSNRIV